jgi:hypothetical protein
MKKNQKKEVVIDLDNLSEDEVQVTSIGFDEEARIKDFI